MSNETTPMNGTELSSQALAFGYDKVRRFTEFLCQPLTVEDYVVQSMPDMSPPKWHLAHTTWFFEAFVLASYLSGYRPLNPSYSFLFNSYYNALGDRHCRDKRGLVTRPTVEEVYQYRRHVDERIGEWLESADHESLRNAAPVMVLGLNHEQQHQELLLTDVKHLFAVNPLRPTYHQRESRRGPAPFPLQWKEFPEGLHWIGHHGDTFAFDNEKPRHQVFAQPFQIASRLVTNEEYLTFMQEGGYQRPEFWLSEGWDLVQKEKRRAPLYWQELSGAWWQMTLAGLLPIDLAEPVCHVSYFEACAFAAWAGARLPTESEWEIAVSAEPVEGNFVESAVYHPLSSGAPTPTPLSPEQRLSSVCESLQGSEKLDIPPQPVITSGPFGKAGTPPFMAQAFGDVWEWTLSAYAAYPGFKTLSGALGEYNGKFMCNQFVLRGGSCVTSRSHIRPTYRNFFPPAACWQFTGIRLAKDL
jgi:ergothioneine biosynthesis protein EgtB